jgi:hypothetical protein
VVMKALLCPRWRPGRAQHGLSTLRELLSLVLLLAYLVELGDALVGRWALHVLLTPVVSLLGWAVWLPLHRAPEIWTLRSLSSLSWLAAGACRLYRVAQLVSLPLDWSHMRPHAAAWSGGLCLTMFVVEGYSTCRMVSIPSPVTLHDTEATFWRFWVREIILKALDRTNCLRVSFA